MGWFALTRYPFDTPAETDEPFPIRAGIETLTRLQHLFELPGIGLLTGAAGCGMTTVCRLAAARLHPSRYRFGYIAHTTGSVPDTCQSITWGLGLAAERTRAASPIAPSTRKSRASHTRPASCPC